MDEPDPPGGSGLVDGTVRWPLLARLGLALAVVTVAVAIAAAVIAAFVVGPTDDGGTAPPARVSSTGSLRPVVVDLALN